MTFDEDRKSTAKCQYWGILFNLLTTLDSHTNVLSSRFDQGYHAIHKTSKELSQSPEHWHPQEYRFERVK